MMYEGSNLLLNLLIILIAVTVHQLWVESKPNSSFVKNYGILITSAIAILFCMTFSFYQEDGLQFDLRRIPLWIGTIYGGPFAGVILCIEIIIIRLLKGGPGVIVSIISTPLFVLLTIFIRPYYFRLRTFHKVILGSSIILLFGVIILSIASIVRHKIIPIEIWLGYLMTNLLGIILVNLSIEAIRKNYLIRMKIFRSAKLDIVGHLAAAVNHEIKNPLTTVRGMMHILKEDPTLPNDKRESFFQISLEEIDKIDKIVTDYLTFARPYPNKIEQISIEKVLSESVRLVKPLADQTNVRIEIIGCNQSRVSGDHAKFVQAIVNILKNSIDASAKKGKIKIESWESKSCCYIHIVDNGMGMNDTILSRLGEPYFTMTSNGTGLGMMVVFKIIESMRGKIKIKSEPGKGTSIMLELPVAMNESRQAYDVHLMAGK